MPCHRFGEGVVRLDGCGRCRNGMAGHWRNQFHGQIGALPAAVPTGIEQAVAPCRVGAEGGLGDQGASPVALLLVVLPGSGTLGAAAWFGSPRSGGIVRQITSRRHRRGRPAQAACFRDRSRLPNCAWRYALWSRRKLRLPRSPIFRPGGRPEFGILPGRTRVRQRFYPYNHVV